MVEKIAVVGLGSIGRRHVRTISRHEPGIEVFAVRREQNESVPEEKMVVSIESSHAEAISRGVEAAIICSPASHHISDAIPYLEAGLPLLMEKPLAKNVRETEGLFQNFISPPNVLIGYTLRHAEGFHWLSKWLTSGRPGRITKAKFVARSFLPTWRPGQDYRSSVSASAKLGGGVLLELSHEIDMALTLFGPFESVSATVFRGCELELEVEHKALISLVGKQEARIEIELDFCSKQPRRAVALFGEKETVVWDLMANTIRASGHQGEIVVEHLGDNREVQFYRQLRHFLDCVGGKSVPTATLNQGIDVLAVIDRVRLSSQLGLEVQF